MYKIINCQDFEKMSEKAADLISAEIEQGKKISVALCGGTSVTRIFEILSSMGLAWKNVNAFITDERWVKKNDKESNFRQADERLFSKAKEINAFAFDIEKGVLDYNKKFFSITKGKLDLILLGVGEDGHIASLFPDNPALKSGEIGYIAVENAPKSTSKRITLSHETIAAANTVMLLFASASKKEAFEKFSDPIIKIAQCPAKIALKARRVFVFTVFGGENAE